MTPTAGTAATITLTDAGTKVAKYAVVEVAGTETDASACDDPAADSFSTTAVSPPASPKEVSWTPVAAGKKACVYAEDAAGNSDAALWTTAIAAAAANAAPEFTAGATATRTLAETVGAATVQTAANIGAAFAATDDDTTDTLVYSLEGADAGSFTVDTSTGQLKTKVGESYDYEAKTSHAVTVKVVDGNGGSDTIAVTVNVTNNTNEQPVKPAAPTVAAVSGSTTSLRVSWSAPVNTGRPAITSYDVQYRKGTSGEWSDGPQDETGTSADITGLEAGSAYQVQVRATNADGDGPWSDRGERQHQCGGRHPPRDPHGAHRLLVGHADGG